MNIVKTIAVLCLPWFLVACGTIPASETARPQAVDKAKAKDVDNGVEVVAPSQPVVKPEPTVVDDAAEAPAAVTALLERAKQQQRSGNEQAAAASLERAIRIAPRYPESYFRLGELRYQQGIYDQARSLAEKALSLGADWWLRREAQSLVERASAADKNY